MEIRDKLDGMLDQLETELPAIVQKYPDADEGDFWLAFAERATAIEVDASHAHAEHVKLRLDRMLIAHNIIPETIVPVAGNEQAN